MCKFTPPQIYSKFPCQVYLCNQLPVLMLIAFIGLEKCETLNLASQTVSYLQETNTPPWQVRFIIPYVSYTQDYSVVGLRPLQNLRT